MAWNVRVISIYNCLVLAFAQGFDMKPLASKPHGTTALENVINLNDDEGLTKPRTITVFASTEPEVSPTLRWQHCNFHRHMAMLSLASSQQLSVHEEESITKPGKKVDTFYPVDCVEDFMFDHSDMFFDKRHSYKLQAPGFVTNFTTRRATNVTVLHYSKLVPKKHQKPMTPKVCFNFCRHIEDMYFFGIRSGRDCYCTPYFQPIPDDSSECDAVCEGDSKLSCGGQTKSSIFEMHACADTAQVLRQVESKLKGWLYGSPNATLPELKVGLQEYGTVLNHTAKLTWHSCAMMRKYFTGVGDDVASELMKRCKLHAAEVQYKSWEGMDLIDEARQIKPYYGNFSEYRVVAKAEKQIAAMETMMPLVESTTGDLRALWEKFKPLETQFLSNASTTVKSNRTSKQKAGPNSTSKQQAGPNNTIDAFAPATSFVNKNVKELMPSVCGGALATEPRVADERGCGDFCANTSSCVGFTHFTGSPLPLCFLFSRLESLTYYPSCPNTTHALEARSFLQPSRSMKEPAFGAICRLKCSKFDAASLLPDPTGKCKTCFKRVIKKDAKLLCAPTNVSKTK